MDLYAARLTGDGAPTTHLPDRAQVDPPLTGPLAPAADPELGTLVASMQEYYVSLLIPETFAPGEVAGPPGWVWARPTEYPVLAQHIAVAALKAVVEHSLLPALPAGGWLAVRWAGYTSPTFYADATWLAARLTVLTQFLIPTDERSL